MLMQARVKALALEHRSLMWKGSSAPSPLWSPFWNQILLNQILVYWIISLLNQFFFKKKTNFFLMIFLYADFSLLY